MKSHNLRLLIVSGGGGHFAPALSVVENLPPDMEYLLVGRKYAFEGEKTLSFEYLTAQTKNLPFKPIVTGRLQRKFNLKSLISFLKIPYGFCESWVLVHRFKPDVLLSFGGYVALPVVFACYLQKIPIVIHEQVMQAGLANKISAKFARIICISWETSRQFFPKEKTVFTGNLLKKEILKPDLSAFTINKKNLPLLFITGGTSGSHVINASVQECLPDLLQKCVCVHQTGDSKKYNDFQELTRIKENLQSSLQNRYYPVKFLSPDEAGSVLAQADLVVGRSGANTVYEILYLGKPCILIPLETGQKNEQLTNALFVQKTGLGEILLQENLDGKNLDHKIEEMFAKIDLYRQKAAKAKELVEEDAAEKIIQIVFQAADKKSSKKSFLFH